jgi:hypothetical protein
MFGSYANTNIGFVENSLRGILGCPVINHFTKDLDPDEFWTYMRQIDVETDFLFGA